MVTLSAPEVGDTLPVASVAVAVMVWVPGASALVVMLYAPLVAVPLPACTPSLRILTVLPVSAAPVNVGVVMLVMSSLLEMPLSLEANRSGVEGAVGGTVSFVNAEEATAPHVPP